MKKLSNILLMAGIALMATLTITSCNPEVPDTNPLNKQGVNLVSYGPNPVARGGYLRMLGTGLDQIQTVTIAGQEITPIEVVSSEEIKVIVPQDAKIGDLVLTPKAGDAITGKKQITYTEPVGFAEENPFAPATVKPGHELIINGEYLNLVTKVIFDGAEVAEFAEQERDHITIAKFPATAKTGVVTLSFVATGDTVAQEIPSEAKLNVVLPSVEKVQEFEEVKAGEKKPIEGKDLDLVVDVVTSTGDTLEYVVNNEGTKIEITMPEIVMNGTISVVTASGVQVPVATIGVALPKVTSVEGNTDVKEGSVITINGTDLAIVSGINFADIKGNAVAVDAKGLSVTDTKVTVALPAAAVSGTFTILTTANINVEDTALFKVKTLKPAITELAVAEVPMGGSVFAMGTNLDLVKNITLVGGAVVEVYGGSATYFHFDIPYAEAETGKLTLNMANGEVVESLELVINAPECCYATAWPDSEVEVKAGTMMVITVANIDKLTGVIIDGEDCQTIKISDQLYIAVPEIAGKGSNITLVSENGSISYPFAFVPNTEQKHTLWKGALPISWSDDGKIHISAKAMEEVPGGAQLILCYTQVDQTWGQAQVVNGNWGKYPDLTNPDGTKILNGEGALVPTDLYGWFEDGILYRETPIVLTDELLTDLRANVDDNGDILHIQGSDLIFNEIRVLWTISLEVDCAPFLKYENREGTFAYPYFPSWSENSGKLRLFRDNGLQDLKLKAGKSKIIFYKKVGTTGQIQISNPDWSELALLKDEAGDLTTLEYVLDEAAMKCVTGETRDTWSETALVMQGEGLEITKITILP